MLQVTPDSTLAAEWINILRSTSADLSQIHRSNLISRLIRAVYPSAISDPTVLKNAEGYADSSPVRSASLLLKSCIICEWTLKPYKRSIEAAGGLDALQDGGLDSDERLRRVLHRLLCLGKTTTMARYHDSAEDVRDPLRIPKWS